ncbi:MAG TPA: DUF434 domain-containing protein [Spirochaetia bacterium]|nr:DUF434 domain-containing protein [Spirochaetia bacterium]
MSTKSFTLALQDYRFLREKGYPEKASLKLVGDRHRLSRVERNTLFRGVIPNEIASIRKGKLVRPDALAGLNLGIDWYNVLITVESFLRGLPLFVSDDGITRDSSATHGSYRRTALTERAFTAIMDALRTLAPRRLDAYLDSPIAFSGLMAEEMRVRLSLLSIPFTVALEHTADYPLKCYQGVVASSDSVILDSAEKVLDLPRFVVSTSFHFNPPSLAELPSSFPKGFGRLSGSESPGP